MHQRMRELLFRYAVVGGMPTMVNKFLDTNDIREVLVDQRAILDSYKDDMVKYARNEDRSRIRECFDSIPMQLAKEYKKFQYTIDEV